MTTSVFQSMPCVDEDLARAQVTAMLTQLASEKKNVRLISIDVRESNGMFIAVATYETITAEEQIKEEEKARKDENQNTTASEEEDRDAEGAVLHTGINGLTPEGLPKDELLPQQTEPAAFEPTGQNNLVAAPEPTEPPPPPAGPDALKPNEEFLADKMKGDFVEAKDPYNVDGNSLVAERAAEAVSGLSPDQVEALKTEIERKLDEGMDPGIMPPGGDKPAAAPPGSAA